MQIKNPRKILIYAKELDGGTERFIENINSLIKHSPHQTSEVVVNKTSDRQRVKVTLIGFKTDGYPVAIKSLFTFMNFFCLLSYVIRFSPDIIFSIELHANILSLLVKMIYKKPYLIISTHTNLDYQISTNQSNFISYLLKKSIVYLYNKADAHFTPSLELKNFLVKKYHLFGGKFKVIPYPTNIKQIKKYSKEAIVNSKIRTELKNKKLLKIVTMGRFEKQKSFENEIIALSLISKKIKNIKLYLIGDGALRKQYVETIRRLNLKKYVTLIHWQRNPYKFMKYANVFVLTSKFEGFPHVLIEALSLNIPVISSDVDFGPREILENGEYGILLDDNSPEEIARRIIHLLSKKHLYRKYKYKSKTRALFFKDEHIDKAYEGLLLIQ